MLGGDRGQRPTRAMRKAAKAAIAARVAERAAELAPVIEELRAAGMTTLRAIASGLTDRGVPTARGGATWAPVQVQRVLSARRDDAAD